MNAYKGTIFNAFGQLFLLEIVAKLGVLNRSTFG